MPQNDAPPNSSRRSRRRARGPRPRAIVHSDALARSAGLARSLSFIRWAAIGPVLLIATLASVSAAEPAAAEHPLSFALALRTAREQSPLLAAYQSQLDADRAVLEVDEGYKNPEVSLEVEDFLGSGVARRLDSTQATVALSQELQLGGKPARRLDVKRAQQGISRWEQRLARQRLEADVALAFLAVLAQQQRLENAKEMARLADETLTVVRFQVEAGRATPIEADKASIARSLVDLSLEEAQRSLLATRQSLAATCGAHEIFFDHVLGDLDALPDLPAKASLAGRIDQHPAVQTESARARYQHAMIALEESQSVPDLTVSLGLRWLNATRDRAVVAGLAIGLPVVDRTRGLVSAARHLERKASQLAAQERLTRERSQQTAYHRLAAAHRRASVLTREVHPKVQETYRAVRDGYRLGRFGYLDLLDAQAALFQIQEQALEARVTYHQSFIELAREAALPLPTALFDAPVRPQETPQ